MEMKAYPCFSGPPAFAKQPETSWFCKEEKKQQQMFLVSSGSV